MPFVCLKLNEEHLSYFHSSTFLVSSKTDITVHLKGIFLKKQKQTRERTETNLPPNRNATGHKRV